jgi:predicted Zn finger-like uncharacterized protein
MSIPATCPGCNADYQLAESMRGKKVRCKSCSEVFVVPSKALVPDRDEDEGRIQSSPRPARRVARDEEDEDRGRPPLRRRPVKKSSNSSALPLIIAACVILAVLVLGLGGVAVWVLMRSRPPQPAPVASNFNPPPAFPQPQPVQDPMPQNPGGMPPQPMVPPGQNPMPANGPIAATLSNANISGFGAQMQVTVDFRFTSGSPQGRRLFLFIKATKAGGMLQNHYVAELKSIGNQMQGTIKAAGMSFGIEHGPFELWMGEGPAGFGPPLLAANDLKQISNVVTVASKQLGVPGMPGMPRMPGMPGMPRPPIGPRGMRP